MLGLILAAVVQCTQHTTPSPAISKALRPAFVRPAVKGVVLIILENGDPKEAAAMGFMSNPAVKAGVRLQNYNAVAHPSRPNYVALVSGDTAGIDGDCVPTPPLNRNHLGNVLTAANQSWKVYAESYRGSATVCDLVDEDNLKIYARRHLGFLDFRNVQTTPALCANIVPETEKLTALQQDIGAGTLPAFALIIPNNVHNGHNLGLHKADEWLKENFAHLLADTRFTKDRVFIITFDENEQHGAGANKVFIAIWGDHVQAPQDAALLSVPYDHYDLLRTIEALLGVGTVGAKDTDAKGARPIAGIWKP
jgi:hypothetical protein